MTEKNVDSVKTDSERSDFRKNAPNKNDPWKENLVEKELPLEEIAEKLLDQAEDSAWGFEIYYHKRPDGDAIGSAYALALGLASLGACVKVIGNEPVPEMYRYQTEAAERILYAGNTRRILRIAVDTATSQRLGKYATVGIDYVLDHHVTNTISAEGHMPSPYRYVEPEAASCAEIIFKLLKIMRVPISKQIADFLYMGLVTDVSCFRSMSTTPASLEAAAELASCGADIVNIGRHHYMRKTPGQIGMEKEVYDRLVFSEDNEVVGSYVTALDYAHHSITDPELGDFMNTVDQICKPDKSIAHAHVLVRELRPGICRVSVTSRLPVNAARICGKLGGGGHDNAAGAELEGNPKDILEEVMRLCRQEVEENL